MPKHKRREYNIWRYMIRRCADKKSTGYNLYGGRGIKVCDRWHKFENFWEDMENGYKDNLSLDRIDNNGNYCKNNCRWATRVEQQNNMRSNNIIEYNGEKLTSSTWAKRINISPQCLYGRFKKGWSVEKALTTPKILDAKFGSKYNQLK